jgi:hypothetical protein
MGRETTKQGGPEEKATTPTRREVLRVALGSVLCALLPNDPASGVSRELQAAYTRAGRAWQEKDAAALMTLVAPGFTQRLPDGRIIERDEAEAALNEWLATTDAVTDYDVRIEALTLVGDSHAVAEVAESVTTTFTDPIGGHHERAQSNTARVTWVRKEHGWQIGKSEYLTARMTIDGKTVDLAAMGLA